MSHKRFTNLFFFLNGLYCCYCWISHGNRYAYQIEKREKLLTTRERHARLFWLTLCWLVSCEIYVITDSAIRYAEPSTALDKWLLPKRHKSFFFLLKKKEIAEIYLHAVESHILPSVGKDKGVEHVQSVFKGGREQVGVKYNGLTNRLRWLLRHLLEY